MTAADLAVGLLPVLAERESVALTEEFLEDLALHFREGVRRSAEGFIDDELALTRPWGFGLAEISAPTMIWHGRSDRVVPRSHGEWLATRVPGAAPELVDGEGHFSLAFRHVDRMLDRLVVAGER